MKTIVYGVVEESYCLNGTVRKSFGIAAYADPEANGTAIILASVSDISADKKKIEALARRATFLQLSPLHLKDVIEDFLAQ